MEKFPIIIHVPHSSTFIPPEIRKDILLSDDELESELLGMTDWYTDEFAAIGEKYGNIIKNDFSRLVVDPERFRDDSNEVMSVLDWLLTPLRERQEKTYSAPFATHLSILRCASSISLCRPCACRADHATGFRTILSPVHECF